ncbi:MAG: cytochrome c peroxidase [Methylophilaceae bacterium]|nr:cytochrome c peroxidase [Methylophilaceae bacterium]
MKAKIKPVRAAILSALLGAAVVTGPVTLLAACSPCSPKSRSNPCAAKNPCAANPCAANPCAAGERVDPKLVTRPKGSKPYKGNYQALVKEGEKLWNSTKLSANGAMSCATCHTGGAMFQATFAQPYPHWVQMAHDRSNIQSVTLEEMVQFCMVVPMQAKPLAWDSRELAALTAYTAEVQKKFKANPCAAKNPCGARNPCAAR